MLKRLEAATIGRTEESWKNFKHKLELEKKKYTPEEGWERNPGRELIAFPTSFLMYMLDLPYSWTDKKTNGQKIKIVGGKDHLWPLASKRKSAEN